jgi:hypothetical protein
VTHKAVRLLRRISHAQYLASGNDHLDASNGESPQARFSVEEQFSDGTGRAVVRWRYDWADGHVRGVDIDRVRHGQLAESLAYVKG